MDARDTQEQAAAGTAARMGTASESRIVMNKRTRKGSGAQPGERSSAEYTPEEIAIARAVGKLRVDEDGLGWIRGMEPKGVK